MELKRRYPDSSLLVVLLLIVPYGIETASYVPLLFAILSFNRTLWNWNIVTIKLLFSSFVF